MAAPAPHDAEPPIRRIGPDVPALPVILSVPHAGRYYTDDLLAAARVPLEQLRLLEDRLVDRLIWRAVAAGATAIVANRPRAEIDLNRHEREMDPLAVAPPAPPTPFIQSARSRSGLGLIPSRLPGTGAIWHGRISGETLARRIAAIHRPFHAAVGEALAQARALFGVAILLDCHSMPPRRPMGERADLVLGDRHGTSIALPLRDAAQRAIRTAGYSVALNQPYAGGHIVQAHGRPAKGIHALQLEIDRSLYLDDALREPGPGFARMAELIASIVDALSAAALGDEEALAAE